MIFYGYSIRVLIKKIQINDALNANRMNVGPGGKHTPVMRDCMYLKSISSRLYDRMANARTSSCSHFTLAGKSANAGRD